MHDYYPFTCKLDSLFHQLSNCRREISDIEIDQELLSEKKERFIEIMKGIQMEIDKILPDKKDQTNDTQNQENDTK